MDRVSCRLRKTLTMRESEKCRSLCFNYGALVYKGDDLVEFQVLAYE